MANCITIELKRISLHCSDVGGSLVDADYQFLYVDVGANGCSSDSGIFADTAFRQALVKDVVGLLETEPLPNDDEQIPYHIVGEDALFLKNWFANPFHRRNMNRLN